MTKPIPRSSKRAAARLMRLHANCGSWGEVAFDLSRSSGEVFDRAYLYHVARGQQRASKKLRVALGFVERPTVTRPMDYDTWRNLPATREAIEALLLEVL